MTGEIASCRSEMLLRAARTSILLFSGVSLDYALKSWARSSLPPGQSVEVFSFLNLTLGFNPGISFGLFPATGYTSATLLLAVTTLVTLAVMTAAVVTRNVAKSLAFALLASGAAGNVVDRFRHGGVTDYLDFHAFDWHWPTFNVADVLITCGLAAVIAAEFFRRPTEQHERASAGIWR